MNFSEFKNSNSLLSKEQMRSVKGGQQQGTCGFFYMGTDEVSTQQFPVSRCGVSKSVAMNMATHFGGRWCCDSCGSTSYCG